MFESSTLLWKLKIIFIDQAPVNCVFDMLVQREPTHWLGRPQALSESGQLAK